MEPPLKVTSDERTPPINSNSNSPQGIFLYILPLTSGHFPPPISSYNIYDLMAKFPPLNGQNDKGSKIPSTLKSKVGKQKFMEIISHQKKKKKTKKERKTCLPIEKNTILVSTFFPKKNM